MPTHLTMQGECINSIAYDYGFHPSTIWEHQNNSSLKELRKDPNVLLVGDAVFVPDKRVRTEQAAVDRRHVYHRAGVPAKLKLALKVNGEPRANEPYVIVIDGREYRGNLDSEGKLEIPIAPNAKQGKITLPDSKEEHALSLGYLDPIDELTGVQARLKNLGFMHTAPNGVLDGMTTGAIRAFQKANNLSGNGDLDESTKAALKSAFGS